jgi:CDP-6-deoxy-D-xylo-4-hexulose-3-dehydrase
MGLSDAILVNSGSSANLVAISALTSEKLGERRLKAGDEIITVAAGFPTTVAPIVQNQLVPVFVDVNLGDYTISTQMEEAVSPKTRAIFMAHTLGKPFDLDTAQRLAREHDLWWSKTTATRWAQSITINLQAPSAPGHQFFLPCHHITMGEGAA